MSSYYNDTVKDALFPKKKGIITKRNKFLVVNPPERMESDEVRKIRKKLSLSVSVFAEVLNVSPKTVEAWEAGRNHPEGAACRLLALTQNDPAFPVKAGIVNQ